MASYISAIKKWFKAGNEGRHLELILLEISKIRPELFAGYLCHALKGLTLADLKGATIEVEKPFVGHSSKRRADMAVTLEGEAEPSILIEIKYFDSPRQDQLPDYQRWKGNKPGRHVLVLSREFYRADSIQIRLWDDLARYMRKAGARSDLAKVIVDYLEEEGIVMQNVDRSALRRYFVRLVCHDQKVGRVSGNIDGPIEFAKVLKNMKMLSSAFVPHFKDAWESAGEDTEDLASRKKSASIDFRVRNRLHVAENAEDYQDDGGDLPSDLKDGGSIDVFATHSLGHNADYLRFDYGMNFLIPGSSDNSDDYKVELYASARGKKINGAVAVRTVSYRMVTECAEVFVSRIQRYMHSLILNAVTEVIDGKHEIIPKQKKALKLLQKSLNEGNAKELGKH